MKNFKFHEKDEIDNMVKNNLVDEEDYRKTISMLAIYNFQNGLDKEKNYDAIKTYMQKNSKDFFEAEYMNIIYKEIRNAKKRIVRDISEVCITQSELDKISSLNDIKKEKITFVILATSKYYDTINHSDNHSTYLKNSEICKMARVTIKSNERDQFMHFLYTEGLIYDYITPTSTCKKVNFISDNNDDIVAISLSEIDFEELAYIYLYWKNNGEGYSRCLKCNRMIKQNKNRTRKYCEECANIVQREQKTEWKRNKSRKDDMRQNG